MLTRLLFVLLLTVLLASVGVRAQTPPGDKDEVLKVETQLVDVPIVVADKTGKAVLGLKKSNFVIYEDSKPQAVEEFSTTTAPFEVALLLDTSGSTRSELQLIQRAAQHFISLLRPGDRVAIVSFNTFRDGDRTVPGVDVLAPLTSDRATLTNALEKMGTSNGTPYYDSLIEIAEKVFKNQPAADYRGRRALVALTDGVDSTSASGFAEAQELLSQEGIINFFIQVDTRPFFEENLLGNCLGAMRLSASQIRRYYVAFGAKSNVEKTVDFCKLGDFEKLAISKRLYEIADSETNMLAKSSGGKVFPAADLSEARMAFKTVADTIGTQYRLGYYSTNDKHDGTYRKIRVELKGLAPGTQVRAREGYSAPSR